MVALYLNFVRTIREMARNKSECSYSRGIEIQGLNLLRQGIFISFILVWDIFLEQRNAIHLESCHPINTLYTLTFTLYYMLKNNINHIYMRRV